MIEDIFDEDVIFYIKNEIAKANNHEVFFVGCSNEYGIIDGIKSLAKGNNHSVPVIFDKAYKGDCVIHNHPSGNLTPSDADINIASKLANDGIGFMIINNDMTDCYIVVENIDDIKIQPLDSFELLKLISKNGAVSKLLPNYEPRESQELMLEKITECFNDEKIALIEAGTGTGKSLAYLLPAISWAVKNKEKVVISTNTINLQEQLMKKDIPLLYKAMGGNFAPILVKGAGNYICFKKLYKAMNGTKSILIDDELTNQLEDIIEYANHKAKNGSRDEIGFIPDPTVWEKVNVETDLCTRNRCMYFSRCFFFKARKACVKADILIVNHHLLCADVAIRKEIGDFSGNALLPYYSKLVIDEAHNLEDVATNYFGTHITRIGLKRLLTKIYRRRRVHETGILAQVLYLLDRIANKSEAIDNILNTVENDIVKEIKKTAKYTDSFFDELYAFVLKMSDDNKTETKFRLIKNFNRNLQKSFDTVKEEGKILSESLLFIHRKLKEVMINFRKFDNKLKDELKDEIKEVESLTDRIFAKASILEENLSLKHTGSKVYWVELRNKDNPKIIKLASCPLNVSKFMKETIFGDYNNTVIMTSATLTSNKNFEFIKHRIGLDELGTKLEELILESPFNYETQMSICIPMDIVEPKSNRYNEMSTEYVKKIIDITGGSTFLLFTSFYSMNYTYNKLLETYGNRFTLLKQGLLDRHSILTRFKNTDNAILLGTDSFWEGVDVSGDSLRCVVLMRLPFRVPTEPIIQARIEKMQEENINSFMEYTVPQTVIKFRQGFGRLIRSTKDTGCVVCLDRRIATKFYGNIFLESLPPARRVIGYSDDILSEVRKYFN